MTMEPHCSNTILVIYISF